MLRRIVPVLVATLMFSTFVMAQSAKYGAPVTVQKTTSISELYAAPDKFVGKTIRVDGVATSVCTEMGC